MRKGRISEFKRYERQAGRQVGGWRKEDRDRMVTVGPKYLKRECGKAKHGTSDRWSVAEDQGPTMQPTSEREGMGLCNGAKEDSPKIG